jgi:hypothetical protein
MHAYTQNTHIHTPHTYVHYITNIHTHFHTHTNTHTHNGAGYSPQQCDRLQTRWAAINPLKWQEFILASTYRPALWPSQPPILRATREPSLGTEQPAHETDHSRTFCVDVKNMQSFSFNSPLIFTACGALWPI